MAASACSRTRRCWIEYVRLIDRTGAKVTAFLVTSLLDRYGDRYRRLGERIPVEFEIHSHAHDLRDPCSRADIEAAMGAFRGFAGSDPIGYRAPVGKLTREGLDTLLDLGFRYDSSIYPSVRPGKWGHNNLHLSVAPFRITRGDEVDHRGAVRDPLRCAAGLLSELRQGAGLEGVRAADEGIPAARSRCRSDPSIRPLRRSAAVPGGRLRRALAPAKRECRLRAAREDAAFPAREGYEFAFLSDLCDYLAPAPLPELSIEKVIR